MAGVEQFAHDFQRTAQIFLGTCGADIDTDTVLDRLTPDGEGITRQNAHAALQTGSCKPGASPWFGQSQPCMSGGRITVQIEATQNLRKDGLSFRQLLLLGLNDFHSCANQLKIMAARRAANIIGSRQKDRRR